MWENDKVIWERKTGIGLYETMLTAYEDKNNEQRKRIMKNDRHYRNEMDAEKYRNVKNAEIRNNENRQSLDNSVR